MKYKISSDYYIDVNLSENVEFDVVSKIVAISNYGWELGDGHTIGYIPFGDNYSFDWKFVPTEMKAKVVEELKKKLEANETIGVMVSSLDSDAAANLLYLPKEKQISFSLASNTKLDNGINDFKLYEEKLLPWIQGEGIKFRSIHFTQTDSGGQLEFEKKILGES
jgi:hypothetical protein